jgi:hypothetical protein
MPPGAKEHNARFQLLEPDPASLILEQKRRGTITTT